MTESHLSCDLAVIGGGVGGVAAALTAVRLGLRVVLTEESAWLGGQLTSQAVPPDEHRWIEEQGSTATYRDLRNRIRDHYLRNYPVRAEVRSNGRFDPGRSKVSRIAHEPRVSLAVVEELLAPYRSNGQLAVLMEHTPTVVATDGDRITAVGVRGVDGDVWIEAPYVIDATELGELLELAEVEHVIGSESRAQTGELHALAGDPDPLDQQAISWCFVLDHQPGVDHTIDKPVDYDTWVAYRPQFWPGPLLSWTDVYPISLNTRTRPILAGEADHLGDQESDNHWRFRRILSASNFEEGFLASDLCLINWPQIDYWGGPLVGVTAEQQAEHLRQARQQSLSFLYWMQTEAPRWDGGTGFAGLRLRGDVVGTDDLAMRPYIREARRIVAETTVVEEHVGVLARREAGLPARSEVYPDTVGTGSYRIDLHPSTGDRTYVDVESYPFQIPLGAMVPVRVDNLIPAAKNIGTTHITNGCYRLHPVEWTIGEVAGALVAHCLAEKLTPRQVRDSNHLADFQSLLVQRGVDLAWREDVFA